MQPVSPEEVSALLDGELSPDRTEPVRLAIAEDAGLRQLYEQMAETDKSLASFAAACQFEPQVSLPEAAPTLGFSIYAAACGLLMVRVLAKVLPEGPGLLLHLAVMVILTGWLFCRFLPGLQEDRWRVASELGQILP